MSRNKMANKKVPHHVEFEKDTEEFVPYREPQSPVRTAASSSSINRENVFLDEIALIKRHMIPRKATLKNRKMAVASQEKKAPDFWPEYKMASFTRGVKNNVPYTPSIKSNSTTSSYSSRQSTVKVASARSALSRVSTVCSKASMFEPAVSVETRHVGQPCENASLKTSKLRNGERIELFVDGGVVAIETTNKHSIIISTKD